MTKPDLEENLENQNISANQAAFHRALLASGLVRRIKAPALEQKTRHLIQVQGEPISQSIIDERR
jgi:hypothetical protein